METITGKIEKISTKGGAKDGKAWFKTSFLINGAWYSKFGKTVDKEGDEVTLEYVTSKYGNDIVTIKPIAPAGQSQLTQATSAPGTAPEKEKKARGALDVFQHDMNVMIARDKALTHAGILKLENIDQTADMVIAEARKFEAYLLGRDIEKIEKNEKAQFEIMRDLVIKRVTSAKEMVPCDKVDKYFIIDPESREAIYIAAEETGKIRRENGFWIKIEKEGTQ